MIRVVVVDDEPMVCAHLRTILGSSGTIEVVGEAHDGAAGVEAVVRSRPDVVLMDLRMPGVDGLTAIERIGQLADPGLAGTGSGLGLASLRQRIELVHGTLHAGPGPDGGFCVEATLPAFVPTAEPVASA